MGVFVPMIFETRIAAQTCFDLEMVWFVQVCRNSIE